MEEAVLRVEHLQVQFKAGRGKMLTAVEDVTFEVRPGETLGVVGESGCGKSVTANTILKLLPKETAVISKGSILFHGKDIVGLSNQEMNQIRGKEISMIFQEPMTSLNPVYRIGEQMEEMYCAHGEMTKKEARIQSIEMLKKVGIPSPETRIDSYPHQLSGGMRQRVMIAMALSTRPELLIADEPTTALDVTIQAQVLELMKKLQQEMHTAIMLITHDMGVIAEMADYVIVMYAGEVVEYGSTETIFRHPLHPYTQGLLNSLPRVDQDKERLNTIPGTVPALWDMPKGCRFCNRCSFCQPICTQKKPSLDAVEPHHHARCFFCRTKE
jgi:oligopeptide/dipeptide ABC transporter ATP-binding protein